MSERLDLIFPGGKRVDVRIREYEIPTDQSVKAGGEASSPEPFDLFLASMVACAGIYALNFCQSRGIATEGLGVSMLWESGEKPSERAKVQLQLALPADFPEKYRSSIVRAMDLCAVKKHVQSAPDFSIEILD